MMYLRRRNQRSGFMLLEVMITIAILGLAMGPIFILHTSALRSLYRYSGKIRVLFFAKRSLIDFLYESQRKNEDEIFEEKLVPKSTVTVTQKIKKVAQNSSLGKIKDLHVVKVTAKSSRKARESIVSFVYRPEQEEQ